MIYFDDTDVVILTRVTGNGFKDRRMTTSVLILTLTTSSSSTTSARYVVYMITVTFHYYHELILFTFHDNLRHVIKMALG